jgi:hypothetical protein
VRIEYIGVNTNKLHDELIAHGIVPLLVQSKDNVTWITYPEGTDMAAVQAIIDAHDPTPVPPQPTEADYLVDLDYRLSKLELGL